MKNFKNGQELKAFEGVTTINCWYIGTTQDGKHVVQGVNGAIYAVSDQHLYHKPTLLPYTPKTFPKKDCWLRLKKEPDSYLKVLALSGNYITAGNYKPTFEALLESYEISLDNCETWETAGIKEN